MTSIVTSILLLTLLSPLTTDSFLLLHPPRANKSLQRTSIAPETVETPPLPSPTDIERLKRKQSLLGLIGKPSTSYYDPVLACPITKEPLEVTTKSSPIIGTSRSTKLTLSTSTTFYDGSTDTYYNLLSQSSDETESSSASQVIDSLRAFLPPPIRATFSDDYIPMRDLFTSPAVSFAYERGWRQGFAAAGFPGADKEFEMVKGYFQPATSGMDKSIVVDMSCATGLFTRRLASSGEYSRVIGCDYSQSMLQEARRRIRTNTPLKNSGIELVRCDVAQIPMQDDKVDALHAGAAMHCWPDVNAGLEEIYRVLKPGGRYFATTFLSNYFRGLQASEGGRVNVSQQAFNYFESIDQLRTMLTDAGFEEEKVDVELLGSACIVIRCEK